MDGIVSLPITQNIHMRSITEETFDFVIEEQRNCIFALVVVVVFFMHFWFNPSIWQKLLHFHVVFSSFNLRKRRKNYFYHD